MPATTHAPAPPARFVATVRNSEEVTLFAAADLDYWRDALRAEDLYPSVVNSRAEVVVSAVRSKWMGMKFKEFLLAVSVCLRPDGTTRDGIYLAQAFNTSSLLSWCERTFFKTPYVQNDVNVHTSPARCQAGPPSDPLITVRRLTETLPAGTTPVSEAWDLPIYLPSRGSNRRTMFHARLSGDTTIIPFTADDTLKIRPTEAFPVLQAFVDSNVTGVEWHLRPDATHSRSKTLLR